MLKKVRYNGGKVTFYGCTYPNKLHRDEIYEVVNEYDRGWQTDYELKGVEGHFNSLWFDEINHPKTYLAICDSIPKVGQCIECSRIEIVDAQLILTDWKTSTVVNVQDMGSNIYAVTTLNSIYIVQVCE